jgi:hypothetical protein
MATPVASDARTSAAPGLLGSESFSVPAWDCAVRQSTMPAASRALAQRRADSGSRRGAAWARALLRGRSFRQPARAPAAHALVRPLTSSCQGQPEAGYILVRNSERQDPPWLGALARGPTAAALASASPARSALVATRSSAVRAEAGCAAIAPHTCCARVLSGSRSGLPPNAPICRTVLPGGGAAHL